MDLREEDLRWIGGDANRKRGLFAFNFDVAVTGACLLAPNGPFKIELPTLFA